MADIKETNERLAELEFHSVMKPIEVDKVLQLIASRPEFAGMAICSDGPLPAEKVPKNTVPVVIKMPKSICAPDFWRELSNVLSQKDSLVQDVEQSALRIADTQQQKEETRLRIEELKATSPDWQ